MCIEKLGLGGWHKDYNFAANKPVYTPDKQLVLTEALTRDLCPEMRQK